MSSTQCANCSKTNDQSLKRCSRCKRAVYCSIDCQTADWKSHKALCAPPPPEAFVRGMVLGCQSDPQNDMFNDIDLDATHPIHTRDIVCPVSAKVGLPLVMYRHIQADPLSMDRDPGLDNQRATFLMIDPESGFAPPK
ncbi:hypothetical protein B0H17DRAFT_164241 [Mycena rosella]|uniref:MYND-type domain-containing protein n=1 Tax=Mycena rosella TaxID=1033263 RepID=A0AAD7DWY5_MYCRO|nr:hypothetical protein B0H17DRAFT_164241 [Mycena rosella]